MPNKQLTGVAGELFVAYKLIKEGWFVVNANCAIRNMPNFDLIALKNKYRVTIQVKASNTGDFPLGQYQPNKKKFVNTKSDPLADVVAFVKLFPEGKHEHDRLLFVSANKVNKIAKKYGDAYLAEKRESHAKIEFPLSIPLWKKSRKPQAIEAKSDLLAVGRENLEELLLGKGNRARPRP